MTTTTKDALPRRSPHDPDRLRCQRIATDIDRAWRMRFSGRGLGTPLGVVAALSLISRSDEATRTALAEAEPDVLAARMRGIWSGFARLRPDLMVRVLPLAASLTTTPHDPAQAEEISAVARAAINAGIFALMADDSARQRTDLLGEILATLRSGSDTPHAWGQVFTPPAIAHLLSAAQLHGAHPGQSVLDFCSGTGSLLMAAAQELRERGIDPASLSWAAVERDPLTAACLAVNTHLWGLGEDVLIGCADVLTEDWPSRARAERRQGLDIARWAPVLHATRPRRPRA